MNARILSNNPDERFDFEREFGKCQKRSKLHTNSNMAWLNKHQHKENPQAKELYRYLPEERVRILFYQMKHLELTLLFQKFDKDGSNALDFDEVYRMFNKYGIFLSRDELIAFFKVVDVNKDYSLNLQEFKSCYLDPAAKAVFAKIMRQLSKRTNLDDITIQAALQEMNDLQNPQGNLINPSPLLPSSFQGVISLLTYLNHRDEIKALLASKGSTIKDQFGGLKQLIELSSKMDTNQKVAFERRIKIPKTDDQRIKQFRCQLDRMKSQAKQSGMEQAEEELRKKNSAHLITVVPERFYKYAYQRTVSHRSTSENKFKPLLPSSQECTNRPQHSDQRVNKFFKFMNIQVPEDLKQLDNKIWTRLFQNNRKLDVILERNKRNEQEVQKTDRLRNRIKDTLEILETNLHERFDSQILQKQKVEIPAYEENMRQNMPTVATTRQFFTPDRKWQSQSRFFSKQSRREQS